MNNLWSSQPTVAATWRCGPSNNFKLYLQMLWLSPSAGPLGVVTLVIANGRTRQEGPAIARRPSASGIWNMKSWKIPQRLSSQSVRRFPDYAVSRAGAMSIGIWLPRSNFAVIWPSDQVKPAGEGYRRSRRKPRSSGASETR